MFNNHIDLISKSYSIYHQILYLPIALVVVISIYIESAAPGTTHNTRYLRRRDTVPRSIFSNNTASKMFNNHVDLINKPYSIKHQILYLSIVLVVLISLYIENDAPATTNNSRHYFSDVAAKTGSRDQNYYFWLVVISAS